MKYAGVATLVVLGGLVAACDQLVGLAPPGDAEDAGANEAGTIADAGADVDAHADAGADPDAGADVALDVLVPPSALEAGDESGCQIWHPVAYSPAMTAIAIGPKDAAWAIGTPSPDAGSADATIYELAGAAWVAQPGTAIEIAIAPDTGAAWIVDAAGTVSELVGGIWHPVSSSPPLRHLAIGPNNAVWAIGTTAWKAGSPDMAIYQLVNRQWIGAPPGGAIQISVAPDTGIPWIVNAVGFVSRLLNGAWTPTNGGTVGIRWVAAGPAGRLWGIGLTYWTPGSPDYAIYDSNDGKTWTLQPGGATRIAVSPEGLPWLVNAGGVPFHGESGGPCPP